MTEAGHNMLPENQTVVTANGHTDKTGKGEEKFNVGVCCKATREIKVASNVERETEDPQDSGGVLLNGGVNLELKSLAREIDTLNCRE